jgi:hypothetical protein
MKDEILTLQDADKKCPNDRVTIYLPIDEKRYTLITTNHNEERRNVNYLDRKALKRLRNYLNRALEK